MSRRHFLKTLATGVAASQMPGGQCVRPIAAAAASKKTLCKSVRDLGPQFLNNRLRITGQDGATSCLLPSGESLWLFGDTIEGPFQSIRNLDLTDVLSNTASLVPRQNYSDGVKRFRYLEADGAGRARQVIEFDATEDKALHRLWPIHSTCVGNHIYAYYHKITMDPQHDVFETFELNGMGIARAVVGEYQFLRLIAPDGTKQFWKGNQPGFGVFLERLADGYLYLWGCFWTGMFLARTRPETLEDLASYEYLVEAPTLAKPEVTPVWRPEFAPSAVLFDGVPNELSVAYNPYLRRHLAIHVVGRQNQLAMRSAPTITGPWSEPQIFYTPPRRGPDDLFTAGKEHPEMRQEGGKVLYVTYVNSSDYIPNLLEVTLA